MNRRVADHLDVLIWRGDREGGGYVRYAVPERQNQTVLDVVTWIHQNLEPGLAYRFSCRVGMCGSCAMMINGRPGWTCRTHVRKVARNNSLSVGPLRNFPVIRDLATDMSGFFDKWLKAEGVFHQPDSPDEGFATILPDSPERMAADAAIECINCGVCHAACDVVELNRQYLGPAALNRAWSLVNDARDGARTERIRAVSGTGGCQNCHSQQGCATFCPVGLNPTASIAGLKRETALAAIRGEL